MPVAGRGGLLAEPGLDVRRANGRDGGLLSPLGELVEHRPQVLEVGRAFVGRALRVDQAIDGLAERVRLGDRDQLPVGVPDPGDGQTSIGDLAPHGDDLGPLEDGKARPRLVGEAGFGLEALVPAFGVGLGLEEPAARALGSNVDFPAGFPAPFYSTNRCHFGATISGVFS